MKLPPKRPLLFVGFLVLMSAFILFSLNYGWPWMDGGTWIGRDEVRPRWFPSASGGVVITICSITCLYLMYRWGSGGTSPEAE